MTLTYVLCALAAVFGLAGAFSLRRRAPAWAVGLLLGAVAVACYAWATAGSPEGFKLYYALGASMLPAWLGVGNVFAAFGPRSGRWALGLVVTLSVLQVILTGAAGVDLDALQRLSGGNGEKILVPGPWVVPTVVLNTLGLGFAAVAAFYAWWRAFRRPGDKTAALAIGLSVVVLGVLARSASVYSLLSSAGGGQLFMLQDVCAFALVWIGALLCWHLPSALRRWLGLDAELRLGAASPV